MIFTIRIVLLNLLNQNIVVIYIWKTFSIFTSKTNVWGITKRIIIFSKHSKCSIVMKNPYISLVIKAFTPFLENLTINNRTIRVISVNKIVTPSLRNNCIRCWVVHILNCFLCSCRLTTYLSACKSTWAFACLRYCEGHTWHYFIFCLALDTKCTVCVA